MMLSGVPDPRSPLIWLWPLTPPAGRALFYLHLHIISTSHLILSSWFSSVRRALSPRWQLGWVWGISVLGGYC